MRIDIDFNLTPHPLTGDLAIKRDKNALKQSIRNIVLTSYYERGFFVEFGTPIRASLFENVSPLEASTIKDNITTAIQNFEPQAELIDVFVEVENDTNEMFATVIYSKLNSIDPERLVIELQRIR